MFAHKPKGLTSEEVVPLVSFPRSGNTWLRFLLANCLKKDPNLSIDYRLLDKLTPTAFDARIIDLGAIRDKLIPNSPVLVKEHYSYADMPSYRYTHAIYIYRERADALKSYWAFVQKRHPGMYPNIPAFLRYYGHSYGTWEEHVRSWLKARDNVGEHSILVLRYEDLVRNTLGTLTGVLRFLGCDVQDERIRSAVEESSYDKIKRLNGIGFEGGNIIERPEIERSVFEQRIECGNRLQLHTVGALYAARWRAKDWAHRLTSEAPMAAE